MTSSRIMSTCAIGLGIALALIPGTALAHAGLESSNPSPSAVLEESPPGIDLSFSEPVQALADSIRLFDADRRPVELPEAETTNDVTVHIGVPHLSDGLYLVVWRVLSADGHVARGAFTFQVGTTSPVVDAQALLEAASTTPDVAGSAVGRDIARALSYIGACVVLGTLSFVHSSTRRRTRGTITVGWWLLVIGTLFQFATQGVYVSARGWGDLVSRSVWGDVASTRFGESLLLRLPLLVLLGILIVAPRRRQGVSDSTWWRSTTTLVGAGIAVTFALAGHPSTSSLAAVASGIDAVHLIAVIVWIGGLVAIMIEGRDERLVNRYSTAATIAMPVAVATGVWQAWHLSDGVDDITATQWGRSLVVKTVVVVAALTLGGVAHLLVTAKAHDRIRRLIVVEVALALAILIVTSSMVHSPPRVVSHDSAITVSLAQGDIIGDVTVTPGHVGSNEIHLTIVTPLGSLAPVLEVAMRLTKEGSDLPPIAAGVTTLGPNHYRGDVTLLESGTWSLELIVTVSASRIVRLSTQLVI